jgi:site-specific DNA-methyltransferase (adenine-specific)
MWEQIWRVLKPNGACLLFGSEPFSSRLRVSQIKNYKYDWVWEKENGTNVMQIRFQPFKVHEIVSVFSASPCAFVKNKKSCQYFPQMTQGKPYAQKSGSGHTLHLASRKNNKIDNYLTINDTGERFPRSVLRFNSEKGLHPTQKPVPLLEYLIKTYTLEGETVLDFTMGSGSTGVACVNTGRKFIGIEMDDKYFEIAKQRIETTPKTLLP